MATEEEGKEGQEGEEQAKGGGSKMMIIIIVVVLLVVVGGAGAFFALSGSSGEEGEDGEDEEWAEEEEDEGVELPGALYPLETFIVNLGVKGSFLKTQIQLEFAEPELPHSIEHDVPKVRDAIIGLLSNSSATEILSADGKEALRESIRDGVNDTLGGEEVVQVYFTEFIVQ